MTVGPAARAGLALFAVYAVLTCGFDVSEGQDDATLARQLLRSGRLSRDAPLNGNWVRGADGRYYSSHEAGNAIALVPAVYLADGVASLAAPPARSSPAWIAGGLLPLVAALYVALIGVAFCICLETLFGMPPRVAVTLTLAIGFTTMLAPYSRMLFDGVLASALTAGALACATLAPRRTNGAFALAAGLLTAAAFATRQPLVLLALPVVAHFAFDAPRRDRWRYLALFACGLAPGVAWQAWYNAVRTGLFYVPAVAMSQFDRVNGSGNVVEGLAGLFFSPGKSIFLYSPLLVLAPFGWSELRRRTPGLAWGLLAGVVAYLVVHAGIRNWAGDWGWGPRYAVPLVMPLMLLAAPAARNALTAPWSRRVVVTLAMAGLCVQLVALATNWHYHYAHLVEQGRFDRATLAWSLGDGQLIDTSQVFARNIGRFVGFGIDPVVVGGASIPTVASGNSINVWPTIALAAGVPASLVLTAALMALTVASLTVGWALRTAAPGESPS